VSNLAADRPLNDAQLQAVMIAPTPLPVEKRGLLLERVAAALELRGPAFITDADVEAAIESALSRLIHHERRHSSRPVCIEIAHFADMLRTQIQGRRCRLGN